MRHTHDGGLVIGQVQVGQQARRRQPDRQPGGAEPWSLWDVSSDGAKQLWERASDRQSGSQWQGGGATLPTLVHHVSSVVRSNGQAGAREASQD